jgi:hypothetical protein
MTTTQDTDELDSDWLDKVLEQYWRQRHGMYQANQDDVAMANREAKDSIANKIVELVLKDRVRRQKAILDRLLEQADEYFAVSDTRVKDVRKNGIVLQGLSAVPVEAIKAELSDKERQ